MTATALFPSKNQFLEAALNDWPERCMAKAYDKVLSQAQSYMLGALKAIENGDDPLNIPAFLAATEYTKTRDGVCGARIFLKIQFI